ncbi:MAG: (d)CMP kinase [Candidatus Babeliales bacterium]
MVITIDGPTASGKSTIAARLAQQLGYYYLNSGYLYRGISYLLLTKYNYTIDQLINPIKEHVHEILDPSRFVYSYYNGIAYVSYDGVDITSFLKTKENDQASSIVSANSMVRDATLDYQRHITKNYSVVAEGRDTGTIVFPCAEVKFFLTASPEIRAKRWQQMQAQKGKDYSLEQAIKVLAERDARDSERAIAPLIVPEGAYVLDSSNLSQDQVIEAIIARISR